MFRAATPRNLFVQLIVYFTILIGAVSSIALITPEALNWLPISGTDAIEMARIDGSRNSQALPSVIENAEGQVQISITAENAGFILLFLSISLMLTMIIMLPITWTYKATQEETGYRKTFVRALIVLPICATTIVLLIQDSLALAFGLAALVAAVRFRVTLRDPIDGIYIFSAICVGLAAGIGYMGIACVMAIFFCFANAVLWSIDYGKNPLDEARSAKDRKKIERS